MQTAQLDTLAVRGVFPTPHALMQELLAPIATHLWIPPLAWLAIQDVLGAALTEHA
jgi:hypothetical protein